jgi:hypothetical protein
MSKRLDVKLPADLETKVAERALASTMLKPKDLTDPDLIRFESVYFFIYYFLVQLTSCIFPRNRSLSLAKDDEGIVVLSARDLKLALVDLANELLLRDDAVFSSLAETHKSVCTQWQKAMETCEKELRACQRQISQAAENEARNAQCAIASRTFDLVLEVTALRAKISRQFDQQMNQEHIIKERVKREYDDLVHSLFSTSFALKNRFEEYRSHLYVGFGWVFVSLLKAVIFFKDTKMLSTDCVKCVPKHCSG